ncbi:MAG: site-specific integrase, partial [Parachlamydiaceae bacterium]
MKQQFLEYLKVVKNVSGHTIRNYAIDIAALEKFVEADGRVIEQIDRKVIRNFLAHLTASGMAKKTIVRRLSALRSFFKYAFENGMVSSNPTETLDTPKLEKKIPASLNYEQVEKLFNTPDTTSYLGLRDRTIME